MFCFIALITSSSPCLKDQFAINNNFSSSYYCTQDSGLQLGDPAPLNSLSLWTCCFLYIFCCTANHNILHTFSEAKNSIPLAISQANPKSCFGLNEL